ncbi:hypothetical protein CLF_100057 [Clonorchis sinensis]|uniref:Uncharacterized protein n=1 Tax=Clonorchis sinensis TaxID=79923 RepID=G7Y2J8_CLOSI|nr:hypothetical protein CLF_100057 [Clonorchis sinensis]
MRMKRYVCGPVPPLAKAMAEINGENTSMALLAYLLKDNVKVQAVPIDHAGRINDENKLAQEGGMSHFELSQSHVCKPLVRKSSLTTLMSRGQQPEVNITGPTNDKGSTWPSTGKRLADKEHNRFLANKRPSVQEAEDFLTDSILRLIINLHSVMYRAAKSSDKKLNNFPSYYLARTQTRTLWSGTAHSVTNQLKEMLCFGDFRLGVMNLVTKIHFRKLSPSALVKSLRKLQILPTHIARRFIVVHETWNLGEYRTQFYLENSVISITIKSS